MCWIDCSKFNYKINCYNKWRIVRLNWRMVCFFGQLNVRANSWWFSHFLIYFSRHFGQALNRLFIFHQKPNLIKLLIPIERALCNFSASPFFRNHTKISRYGIDQCGLYNHRAITTIGLRRNFSITIGKVSKTKTSKKHLH